MYLLKHGQLVFEEPDSALIVEELLEWVGWRWRLVVVDPLDVVTMSGL